MVLKSNWMPGAAGASPAYRCRGDTPRVPPGAAALRVIALALAVLAGAPAEAADRLVLLAQPGPWSAVYGLIGYRGRLWFANAVLFVNHNSADLYSYDPRTGATRYEAHLFSQGAGDPAVAGGLLYWPFEDSRSSNGRGEFMVTDAKRWTWHLLPDAQVFHVHAMIAHRGALYAATSAWRAGLQRSDDGGRTWRVIYEHRSAPGTVSRFTSLAVFGGEVFAGLTNWSAEGVKLYRVTEDAAEPVPAWPEGLALTALTGYRGWLYGVNHGAAGSALWRTDGARSEPIPAFEGERVRDIGAGPGGLWAITVRPGGGALWSSGDGLAWTPVHAFKGIQPTDLAVYGARVYIGAIGPGGRGSLWGPPPPAPIEAAGEAPAPVAPWRADSSRLDDSLVNLDRALADAGTYTRHGEALRAAVRAVAMHRSPAAGAALASRLADPGPDTPLKLFGGAITVPAATLGRWYLLWGLAYGGHGRVPPGLVTAPWTQAANRAEKYLDPAPLAMWAAARLGQGDAATVADLVRTLGRAGDPPWLDGDRIGALTALTGQRFGHDLAAWRVWWARRPRR